MKHSWQIGLAVAILAGAATAQAQMRFQGMDRNNDNVITRDEWRGNDRSFRNQDWNGDGVLSGDEVRTGARRQSNWGQDWNHDGRVDNFDTQIAQRYRGYDMNNDDRVARSEWPGDPRLFTRLDASRDGYLTMQEYTQGGGFNLDALGGPVFRFSNLDNNRDGWVTRNEWSMGNADFDRLDVNRDNRISRFEFENNADAGANDSRDSLGRFNTQDVNRDGWLTRPESRMTNTEFDRLDTNNDNRISRFEYENAADFDNGARRNGAWQSGYGRGLQEGRAAGREDYLRNQGWDLDGQRELERADSGYTPQMGSLGDYQAGYREGFRNAYRDGFNDARDNR
jgi:EF hand